jgi:hypothetical protein
MNLVGEFNEASNKPPSFGDSHRTFHSTLQLKASFTSLPFSRLNINSTDRNSILMLRWEKFQMKICNLLALKVLFLAVKMFQTFSNQKFSHHFLALNFFILFPLARLRPKKP